MLTSVGKTTRIVFLLTLLAFLFNAVLGCWTIGELAGAAGWVAHTHEVLDSVETAFSTIKDAETGVRGYVLTGDDAHLQPYQSASAAIDGELDKIHRLTGDNPLQQENLGRLRALAGERLESLAALVRDARQATSGRTLPILEVSDGKRIMDQIRGQVHEMKESERALLVSRQSSAGAVRTFAFLSAIIGALLGAGMVVTSAVFAAREVRQRQLAAMSLEQANQALEVRVRQRTVELTNTNVLLVNEIEERRRAEQLARETAVSLKRSNQELERFASVASHDLQEPLRKIQAFGDRLREKCRDALGEQGQDYLARMLASAERMRSLIDDLLMFSRVSTRSQEFSTVDLAAVAREVLSDLEGRIHDSQAQVELGALPRIEADALQMRQLFQNLVGNALKFRRPDVPALVQVEATLIPQPAGEGMKHFCEIRVSDNGIGFDETYLDRIFEVFQRLHGRSEYEGTGMGLAITRRIVERHHGTITAKSSRGAGSTFIVTLPTEQTPEDPR